MNKLKGQKIVSCRICKGDHWTTRCPYKDTLGPMQKELAEQLGLSTGEKEKLPGGTAPPFPRGGGQRGGRCLPAGSLTWDLSPLQSRSRCRLSRARRGSTSPRACETEPAAAGSPCSPTAGVRQACPGGGGTLPAPRPPQASALPRSVPPASSFLVFPPSADDNATIRVTNLSEDTRETDLQELFRPFGSISRIYLAKDKTTGQSKVGTEGFSPLGGGLRGRPPASSHPFSFPPTPGFCFHQLPPAGGRGPGYRRGLRIWLRPPDPQRGMGQVSAGR